MNFKHSTGIIILAAGASTRMGQPKQLLLFKDEMLIQRIIQTALTTKCQPIIIVLGAFATEIRAAIMQRHNNEMLESNIILVENNNWEQGMSTSVKMGLKTLLNANPTIDAALFLLVDQPFLTADHLLKLIEKQETRNKKLETSIIASFYNNRAGVPALFDKKWFEDLLQLTGDQGARKLLDLHKKETQLIPFPEGAYDLDTPEDYEFLMQNNQ